MKSILTILLSLSAFNLFAGQVGTWTADPEFLKIKVYAVHASQSTACTDLQTIFESDEPEEVNFLNAPALGAGVIPSGTYPCVVIEMSSQIKYASPTDSPNGVCAAGVENTLTVCQTGDTSTLGDGTVVSCDSNSEVRVALYLVTTAASDGSDNHNQDVWNKPVNADDTTKGFTLQSALVVSLEASGQFVADASGKIMEYDNDNDNVADYCEMGPPLFSFNDVTGE